MKILGVLLLYGMLQTPTVTTEPIPLFEEWQMKDLVRRDLNWTTQAFQRHCNNIDYGAGLDFSECCRVQSGANWQSCNNVGSATFSDSKILCYSVVDGHDCCADSSVCDTGLACSGGTCSQTAKSVTVCTDGCIAYEGRGCKDGTCALAPDTGGGSSVATATAGFTTGAASGPGTATGSASAPTSTVKKDDGGLSKGAEIATIIGSIIGFIALIATIVGLCHCCGLG